MAENKGAATDQVYAELERLLERSSAESGAAEAHGLCCGLLSSGLEQSGDCLLAELFPEPSPGDVLRKECIAVMRYVAEYSEGQLNSTDCNFVLFLPADQVGVGQRSIALGLWCAGFLAGLGLGAVKLSDLSADARELLTDFGQISRVDASQVEGEDNERAYIELVEYVRVGVMLIYEELRHSRAKGPSPVVDGDG